MADPAAPRLSIVIPCRDEIESLPALLGELRAVLDRGPHAAEIVIVDDASRDGSGEWLRREALRDPRLRPVRLAEPAGQSGALAAGFARARGRVIVTMDADLQNDPADVPRLLAALEGADVVSGVRTRRDDPWSRRVASGVANAVRRAVLGDTITDVGCSLKAYRREALDGLPLFSTAHRFLPALCQFRGSRVVEIPVAHRARRAGSSKYGIGNRLARGLWDLVGVRWLRSRLIRWRARPED
jgi:glycosyltransferase involved in cell wall biosynthesis